MSHCVVAVASAPMVSPAVAAAASAAAAGAAAVLIPAAFGYGAYKALEKMVGDYEEAKRDFEARQCQKERELTSLKLAHAARLGEGERFGTIMDTSNVSSAMPAFYTNLVAEYVQRAIAGGDPLDAHTSESLHRRATEGDSEILSILEELHQQLDAKIVTRATKSLKDEDWRSVVSILERDMGSPLLGGPADAAIRAALEKELRILEALPASERPVAIQGIEMLRSRVKRELKERTSHLRRREAESERFRQYAGEAISCFQAVALAEYLPERAAEAKAGLKRLSDLLGQEKNLKQLERLAAEARDLYDATIKALQAERIAEEIGDVLKGMGYQLSPVSSSEGKGCQVSLADDTGLSILVDESGQIKTEMVAYSKDAAQPSAEREERVCDLVTEVFAALDARNIKVRERTRKRRKSPERLPVVARPQSAEMVAPAASPAARRMNVGE